MSIALNRLTKLPAVFSLHDLTKETFIDEPMKLDSAKKFVYRLLQCNFIQPAGPRTSYYYNLIKDPEGPSNRPLEVASLLYPEAIVIGLNVLHAYGWITQIPRTTDVAVSNDRRSYAQIYGIELRPREVKWFAQQQDNEAILRERLDESPFPIDSLTPRAALDDIRQARDIWVPGEDDLFIPDDEEEGVVRSRHTRRQRELWT